mmetsp:Transcript_34689/g.75711  ORF Transcript_34689/g.75711 Transcript_34689/m.75711 type:complete len:240 (+) Transcript_34689:365-1084(+)
MNINEHNHKVNLDQSNAQKRKGSYNVDSFNDNMDLKIDNQNVDPVDASKVNVGSNNDNIVLQLNLNHKDKGKNDQNSQDNASNLNIKNKDTKKETNSSNSKLKLKKSQSKTQPNNEKDKDKGDTNKNEKNNINNINNINNPIDPLSWSKESVASPTDSNDLNLPPNITIENNIRIPKPVASDVAPSEINQNTKPDCPTCPIDKVQTVKVLTQKKVQKIIYETTKEKYKTDNSIKQKSEN